MSAPEVTDKLVEAIRSRRFDLIVCNFANGDMVGHTGKFDAAVKAVETIDQCLQRVLAAMAEVGGETLITADHGNVELMVNPESGQPRITSYNVCYTKLLRVRSCHLLLQRRPGGQLCR